MAHAWVLAARVWFKVHTSLEHWPTLTCETSYPPTTAMLSQVHQTLLPLAFLINITLILNVTHDRRQLGNYSIHWLKLTYQIIEELYFSLFWGVIALNRPGLWPKIARTNFGGVRRLIEYNFYSTSFFLFFSLINFFLNVEIFFSFLTNKFMNHDHHT